MKTIEYYVVTENMDKTEGRGPCVETSIAFEEKGDAVLFANSDFYKRFAVMGVVSHGSFDSDWWDEYNVKKKYVNVYKDMNEYAEKGYDQENYEKTQKAIDKLSDEEYNLLQVHFENPSGN
jgi:hypothetical protein